MRRIPFLAASLVLLWTPPLLAEQPEAERPWAAGVPAEAQAEAVRLFKEGNTLLKDSVFVLAATKYRDALGHWDHPAIHYNLVLALLNMDQPLEVHDHLQKAMRYGAAPLDQDKFEQARSYKVLIEKQLARVDISCEIPGAQVTMDGRPLFTAPGRYEALVRPGPHSVVASAEGYLTNQISRSLPAGELTKLEVSLYTAADITRYRQRWSKWMPWSVLGAGLAVGLAGGALHYGAADNFRRFDEGIEACGGCIPTSALSSTRSGGFTMQSAAMGAYGLGGAALVTGAVLLYLNRPQAYQVTGSTEELVMAPPPTFTVAPLVDGDARGLAAVIRF